jgi:hypothetical protein
MAAMLEKALAEMRFCVENYATSRPSVREWANPSRNHQVDPSIGAITLDAYRAWYEVVVLRGRYSVCYTRITRYSLLHTYSLLITHCSHYLLSITLTTHYSLFTTHYSLLTNHYSRLTTHYSLPPPRGPPPTRPLPRPADDERALHFRKGVETASGTTSHLKDLLPLSLWEVSIASLCMDLLVTSPPLGLPDLERCLPEEWLLGSEDHSLQARQDKLEQLLQWLCQLQLLHKDSSSDCYSRTLHCPPPSVPSLRCIMQFDILFRVRGSSSHRTMTAFMEFMCLCSKVNSTNGEPGSIAEEQACSTGCSLHTTHYSLLTTHYSLLTTHCSLLTH